MARSQLKHEDYVKLVLIHDECIKSTELLLEHVLQDIRINTRHPSIKRAFL